jgi:hypothetical protein
MVLTHVLAKGCKVKIYREFLCSFLHCCIYFVALIFEEKCEYPRNLMIHLPTIKVSIKASHDLPNAESHDHLESSHVITGRYSKQSARGPWSPEGASEACIFAQTVLCKGKHCWYFSYWMSAFHLLQYSIVCLSIWNIKNFCIMGVWNLGAVNFAPSMSLSK